MCVSHPHFMLIAYIYIYLIMLTIELRNFWNHISSTHLFSTTCLFGTCSRSHTQPQSLKCPSNRKRIVNLSNLQLPTHETLDIKQIQIQLGITMLYIMGTPMTHDAKFVYGLGVPIMKMKMTMTMKVRPIKIACVLNIQDVSVNRCCASVSKNFLKHSMGHSWEKKHSC